jgi:ankyrin repeat protein
MANRFLLTGLFLLFVNPVAASADTMHDVARRGDVEALKQSLDQGASLEQPNQTGETLLISAALAGQSAVAEVLIARGANVIARNHKGLTPLHAAAYAGHVNVAALLIDSGADVNDSENRLITTPLHLAAEENRLAVVELLIAKGAAVEAEEMNGYTAITQAGWREHWEVVVALKRAGANCQPESFTGEWLFSRCEKLNP